ncbi:transcription termination factor MTEF1, chloroplastic-like [Carex rostrata]
MSVLLRRLRSSPSLHRLTTPFASTIYRFLSTATTPVPPPLNPHFTPVDYLIQSRGLTSDEAIRTCQKMQLLRQPLKSPHKPDAVLHFLRQTNVTESDIRTSVIQEPRILCSSVEKNLRPNLAKLREIGLSIKDISGMTSCYPRMWVFNFVAKVDFWMQALGSAETVSGMLKRGMPILSSNLEKEEVALMIGKSPSLLSMQDELIGRKMEFLMKEAGCGKIDVVRYPVLFTLSLEKRLIPRNLVRKLLKSKEFPVANQAILSFVISTEQQFVKKFVLPYQYTFPGLLQAYTDACAGKTVGTEWFRSISS